MIMRVNPMNGVRGLIIKGAPEKTAVCNPEEDPHQNTAVLTPWSQTSSFQNCEK